VNIISIKRSLTPYYKNLFGWRTNRKIVVIESDDWGSIRMPSKHVYEKCVEAGYRVDQNPFERYDSLLSEDDLELLFDLLTSYKDSKGNYPVITANALVANPGFEKIRNSGFKEYHYELITETFKNYPNHARCLEIWKEGLKSGIFYPQSHGREHLNVSLFMNALQNSDKDALFGFNYRMPGSIPNGVIGGRNQFVESLNYNSQEDKNEKIKIIIEGLRLFKKLFGYTSESFIPPNYFWSPDFDKQMADEGVRFFQGNLKMMEPQFDGKFKFHTNRLGDENIFGQKYLVRNVIFEPSLSTSINNQILQNCLYQISVAFRLNKPAVICTHRINFAGSLDEQNRDRNLKMLNDLLSIIVRKWPEVEFMNSVQLGKVIEGV
jgi:hypothetical protein